MQTGLKILTLSIALVVYTNNLFADTVDITPLDTHLRLSIRTQEEAIKIEKDLVSVKIKTLNKSLFEEIQKELKAKSVDTNYINTISYQGENFPSKPLEISISLKNQSVEAFTFFRQADGKHIIDLWINKDLVTDKNPAKNNKLTTFKVSPIAPVVTKTTAKAAPSSVDIFKASNKEIKIAKTEKSKNQTYRDFRYGASFIWPYKPMMPKYNEDFNISKKTPEFLYPILDREYQKDKKEAHMQLSINLFRKEKWGHLNKSIRLYEQKYGKDSNHDLNDFLKITALLKDNLEKKNKNIHKTAMAMLSNLAEQTSNYSLKTACYRYLIQNAYSQNNNIDLLEYSKKLYLSSKVEIDDPSSLIAINGILHSLTTMNQLAQLEKFMKEKTVRRILPSQISLGYQSYILVSQNKLEDVIELYNSVKNSLVKPVASAILFNVAETMFRQSNFEQAITLFDDFLKDYNHLSYASFARLRLALSYDFLDRKPAKVLELYAQAINRSAMAEARYEAKIRYVGLRVARKLEVDSADLEHEVFLEPTDDEKVFVEGDIKRLLWLTRLRVLMVKNDYKTALTYFEAIPLDSIPLNEKKVFLGDGRELMLGRLNGLFNAREYGQVVKLWELEKSEIGKDLINDPYAGYIVLSSYLNLGLDQHFEKYLNEIKKSKQELSFPIWIKREKSLNLDDVITEMNIKRYIKSGKYNQAKTQLAKIDDKKMEKDYFLGTIFYNQKKYSEAVESFEKVLIKDKIKLSDFEKEELAVKLLESLYQNNEFAKFKTFTKAFASDLSKLDTEKSQKLLERISYLNIEVLSGDKLASNKEIINKSRDFVRKYKTSNYNSRVKYLLGNALIKVGQKDEAKQVLGDLLKDDKSPGYIKEQAKSDLAQLEIEKSL